MDTDSNSSAFWTPFHNDPGSYVIPSDDQQQTITGRYANTYGNPFDPTGYVNSQQGFPTEYGESTNLSELFTGPVPTEETDPFLTDQDMPQTLSGSSGAQGNQPTRRTRVKCTEQHVSRVGCQIEPDYLVLWRNILTATGQVSSGNDIQDLASKTVTDLKHYVEEDDVGKIREFIRFMRMLYILPAPVRKWTDKANASVLKEKYQLASEVLFKSDPDEVAMGKKQRRNATIRNRYHQRRREEREAAKLALTALPDDSADPQLPPGLSHTYTPEPITFYPESGTAPNLFGAQELVQLQQMSTMAMAGVSYGDYEM